MAALKEEFTINSCFFFVLSIFFIFIFIYLFLDLDIYLLYQCSFAIFYAIKVVSFYLYFIYLKNMGKIFHKVLHIVFMEK